MKSNFLPAAGWNAAVRNALAMLIEKGAGKNLPVVFDFDNTLVCGDIGEATLALLVNAGLIRKDRIHGGSAPAFRPRGRARVTLNSCHDPVEYYERFLDPTTHGTADPAPKSNGYVWAVEVMAGLSILDILKATQAAFEMGKARSSLIKVNGGTTSFPAPFFYEETVELIAELLRHRFDVWIVSASNVWSVRWMVLHGLNPLLRSRGLREGLHPRNVLGVSTLLVDSSDRLHKDNVLSRENPSYLKLEKRAISGLRLTGRVNFPAPVYSGKVASIFDAIGRRPYLAVGDSPGDHALLAFAENGLRLARLDDPLLPKIAGAARQKINGNRWLVQALSGKGGSGFVANFKRSSRRGAARVNSVRSPG